MAKPFLTGSNYEKHLKCLQLAEHERERYFQGQRESIEATGDRLLGAQRWSAHAVAKEIVGDEQMYSRWSQMFGIAALVEKEYGG